HISIYCEKVDAFFDDREINKLYSKQKTAYDMLHSKTGSGNDFLGWVDLPENYDKAEFSRIQKAAAKIRQDSDVLLVIGIGGSYLGARATIEALSHSFQNLLADKKR